MPSVQELLAAVGLPAVVSLVVLLLAWRPWNREAGVDGAQARDDARGRGGGWGPPIALGGAWMAGQLAFLGWPRWPPGERWQWLLPAAGGAMVLGVLAALIPRGIAWRLLVGGLLAVFAAATLQPVASNPAEVAALRMGLAAATLALWLALEPLHRRTTGAWAPLHLAIALSAASIVVLDGGFIRVGMLTGGLAAALGPAVILAAWRRRNSLAPGATAVIAVMLPMILFVGHGYMEADPPVPTFCFVLPAIAPLAGWLGHMPGIAGRRPVVAQLVALAAVVAMCAAAVIVALIVSPLEGAAP